jgi:hypothetical protein
MFLQLIIGLVVLGILLWLINTYLPMDGRIKTILNIAAVVGAVLWVLKSFGILIVGSPLMNLIIGLAILGVVLWAINNYVPMDGKIKKIVNVVIIIVAILGVLQAFGIIPGANAYHF